MRNLPDAPNARTPDPDEPALLVRVRSKRLYYLANDLAQQQELEPLARVVAAALDLAEPPELTA